MHVIRGLLTIPSCCGEHSPTGDADNKQPGSNCNNQSHNTCKTQHVTAWSDSAVLDGPWAQALWYSKLADNKVDVLKCLCPGAGWQSAAPLVLQRDALIQLSLPHIQPTTEPAMADTVMHGMPGYQGEGGMTVPCSSSQAWPVLR